MVWRVSGAAGLKVRSVQGRERQHKHRAAFSVPAVPRGLRGCPRAHGPEELAGPSPSVVYQKELTSLIRDVSVIRFWTRKHSGAPNRSPAVTD